MKPIRVGIPAWTGIAVISSLFFAACFSGSVLSGAYVPACLFAMFCALGALLILAYGPVQVDEDGITMRTLLGIRSIRWNQIERIRMGQSHLVFEGSGVRLVVPQPLFWSGKDRIFLIDTLESFSQKPGILSVQSWSADYQFSRNAKKNSQATPSECA